MPVVRERRGTRLNFVSNRLVGFIRRRRFRSRLRNGLLSGFLFLLLILMGRWRRKRRIRFVGSPAFRNRFFIALFRSNFDEISATMMAKLPPFSRPFDATRSRRLQGGRQIGRNRRHASSIHTVGIRTLHFWRIGVFIEKNEWYHSSAGVVILQGRPR